VACKVKPKPKPKTELSQTIETLMKKGMGYLVLGKIQSQPSMSYTGNLSNYDDEVTKNKLQACNLTAEMRKTYRRIIETILIYQRW
jgi:hypothetical protein